MRFQVNFLLILGWSVAAPVLAQDKVVTGEVSDAGTGDPVPFANLIIKGTNRGTVTDFDGHYEVRVPSGSDSLVASYIGYQIKIKKIGPESKQTINFQLEEGVKNLEEIVFEAGENPAFPIMRRAVKNKKINDKKSLNAYEFESYNKIEFDIDNLTDKFKSRSIVQKVQAVIDSRDRIAGEDGNPVLPIFFSESISKFYFRNNPTLQKEHILKTKITGVGIQDGTLVSQLIGSSFQEYNFYQNWLNILDKEFVSPIADGWRYYYDVFLIDSLYIDDYFCYRVDLYPKRDQDLAFHGTIWITKEHYALKRVDLFIDKRANLNFIEKIKIQQELERTEAGPWIPIKSRVLVDVAQVNQNYAGLLAKFYTSNKDWVIDKPYKPRFYNTTIVMDEQAAELNDKFWEANRHDPLTQTERNVYKMIDTLKTIPAVKTTTDLITYLATGYVEWGKVDLGPWPLTYAYNDINESPALTTGAEGHRFRLGMRTNEHLSKKVELNGYLAYGTRDQKLKYQGGIGFILDRGPWTRLDFKYGKDIQQVGLNANDRFQGSIAFETYVRNRNLVSPYWESRGSVSLERELTKGYNQKIDLKTRYIDPIFNYAYRDNPQLGNESTLSEDFHTTEVTLVSRFGRDEFWVQNDNERLSLGAIKAPIFNLAYTLGIRGVLGGDFNYHKLVLQVIQNLKMGFVGTSRYDILAGRVFGQVPFMLLEGHIGNEGPYYIPITFNLMNFFEFVSDQWVQLKYQHHFQGFILNKIPLVKKLKWRLVGTANVMWGGIRQENREINSPIDTNGNPTLTFDALGNRPYVELGYGIENILKIVRVDAFHRLTYLDKPGVSNFGIKISFQFIL